MVSLRSGIPASLMLLLLTSVTLRFSALRGAEQVPDANGRGKALRQQSAVPGEGRQQAVGLSSDETPLPETVEFNRDIRPILSNSCFECHGPDQKQRKADYRLDVEEVAKGDRGGYHAIAAGDVENSELYSRITSSDPELRMPPQKFAKQLTPRQIALIRRWIEQGAEWQGHWAFIAPKRPGIPKVSDETWVQNPIDAFVLARLDREGLKPQPEADRTTLIRRVTLDLTGLPPTIKEVDDFLADTSANAYERLVERLLDSPHYGEQMARHWLDAARYGDTHGLHLDNRRSIWPYRDWVIRAFNGNMPFDRFTVEQLAGDLLPEPTTEQLVATGFNRCNVTTSEGGSIAEEFRVRYVVDRVETTGTVWLGMSVGCAVCHDHKFDPVSQKEFYQLFAYFNNATDPAMDGNKALPPPFAKVATPEETARLAELRGAIGPLESKIQDELAKIEYVDPKPEAAVAPDGPMEHVWIDDDLPSGAVAQGHEGAQSWKWVTQEQLPVFSGARSTTRTSEGLSQHYFTGAKPGLKVGEGDRLFAYVYLDAQNPPRAVMLQFNDGSWEHRAVWGENVIEWGDSGTAGRSLMGPLPEVGQWARLEVDVAKVGLKPGTEINGWAFTQFGGTVYWDKAGIVTKTPQDGSQFESLARWVQVERENKMSTVPAEIQVIIKSDPDTRTEQQQKQIERYFVEHVYSKARPVFDPLHKELAEAKKRAEEFDAAIPASLVMGEAPQPRETFVLIRGEYDKPDAEQRVLPGVPEALSPLPEGAPANRLGLARWLVDRSHPLTSRVVVNRFWQRYFGNGIVKTAEDFGSQGEWPSHPQLLDWLAVEFIESGWNVKQMQKLMVMSSAYRQSAKVTPALFARDPENRLLARGPRFRMDAEVVRDNALAVSGLLVKEIGGPSVKPYQPSGLWEAVGYTSSDTAKFVKDEGPKLYRRSMYIFWKRTSPPPSMSIFDAPSREACTVRRARTNTPLQALALMNDIQFVEASRAFGERIMTEGGKTPEERIAFAFRLATTRAPKPEELAIFLDVYRGHLAEYRADADAAAKLINVGDSKPNPALEPTELAAWTMVANLILNLDETITKG